MFNTSLRSSYAHKRTIRGFIDRGHKGSYNISRAGKVIHIVDKGIGSDNIDYDDRNKSVIDMMYWEVVGDIETEEKVRSNLREVNIKQKTIERVNKRIKDSSSRDKKKVVSLLQPSGE